MTKLPALQFYGPDHRGSKWLTIDPLEVRPVPALPGCYVIYLDGVLSYIGQSANLRKRFFGHGINYARYSNWIVTPWGYFRSVHAKVRFASNLGDQAMREVRLIHRLRPPINVVGSTGLRRINFTKGDRAEEAAA